MPALQYYVDKTPAMTQLQYLEGNGMTVRFMEEVEGDWRKLADLLGLGARVDTFRETSSPCRKVMVTWLQGAHRTPVKWATLLKVLDEMQRPDIKTNLETALGINLPALSETHRYIQLVDYSPEPIHTDLHPPLPFPLPTHHSNLSLLTLWH